MDDLLVKPFSSDVRLTTCEQISCMLPIHRMGSIAFHHARKTWQLQKCRYAVAASASLRNLVAKRLRLQLLAKRSVSAVCSVGLNQQLESYNTTSSACEFAFALLSSRVSDFDRPGDYVSRRLLMVLQPRSLAEELCKCTSGVDLQLHCHPTDTQAQLHSLLFQIRGLCFETSKATPRLCLHGQSTCPIWTLSEAVRLEC